MRRQASSLPAALGSHRHIPVLGLAIGSLGLAFCYLGLAIGSLGLDFCYLGLAIGSLGLDFGSLGRAEAVLPASA